ncbi:glycosyltransferase family 2 protein [Ramlibacter tataouinensis]|uniref:Candidate b-1,4-glucosyltransferase, Glycosyltransferase Family 2 n=1 Tax=Ramlibacter tataouinensis (strain ATCC BAA-407 / DSM 14655 / LMG 21543 / TTB310) TaxID=365046 RepID=F5XZ33_RAMTT|nr:glycosyltransferase family 2 protein [Ramlibacter tataouinensis]AEG93203.1 candidate b-1,4-glucosyltransferase, Glycosyltransferase Family 2 [Ramlibacter tataouinensis TTB310]
MNRLSIIIVAKNEAIHITECVRSAQFADEVVVLDSGSTDDTVELARSLGARVVVTPDWPGFGPQKNRALDLAQGDWVFSLDADERITPDLAAQIRQAMRSAAHAAYSVNRRSSYCGQYMAHSGWYPDRIVRLWRRGQARFSDDLVHERLLVDGSVGRLGGELLHESMRDFESVLAKVDRYSTAAARALQRRGVKGSFAKALGHGLWAFVRTYLLRRGFLDGRLGLALAISNAEGTYYRYLKLWLLQRAAARTTGP